MPAAANIAIADSVPVTRNYPPRMISGYVNQHADVVTAATAAGQSVLELSLSPASTTKARRNKLSFTLPIEYTDTATGNVLVKDVFRFNGEWVIPPGAVYLQRSNFEALVRNLIADNTVIRGWVRSGEAEY